MGYQLSAIGYRSRPLIRLIGILALTMAVLEIVARVAFLPLAGQGFDAAALERTRLARLTLIDARLRSDAAGASLYRLHPYLGYVGRLGARPWPDNSAAFNDFGMLSVQGYHYPYHRQADEYVVGVLGGSVAEGFANTAQDEFQRALAEADPAFRRRPVVLLPLATGGYKQPQQLFMLQDALLSGFDLDAVINLDGFNEVVLATENRDRGTDPLYPSEGNFEVLSQLQGGNLSPATVATLADIYAQYRREGAVLALVQREPLRRSALLNLLALRWSQASEGHIQQLNQALATGAKADRGSVRAQAAPTADDAAYTAAARVWQQSSAMMWAISRQQGLVYLHALQPNQYVDGSKVLTEAEKRIAYHPANPWAIRARRGYPCLVSAGRELQAQGVPFHDLTMVFRDVADDLYTDDCCHFGPRGHAILAHALAQALATEIGRQRAGSAPRP